MNFLSHYYFDIHANSYEIMGSILPDLLKNSGHNTHLHPHKNEALFEDSAEHLSLLKGWKRHLIVDKYFHASDFFLTNTNALKILIQPVTQETSVRPSFLAHIALELLLDHLLIKKNRVALDHFYNNLANVDSTVLHQFLEQAGMQETDTFFNFLKNFLSSRYLLSYQKPENIGYALNRICMRLWPEGLPEQNVADLNAQLKIYCSILEKDFFSIFTEIEDVL